MIWERVRAYHLVNLLLMNPIYQRPVSRSWSQSLLFRLKRHLLPGLFHLSEVGDISVLNLHFRTGAIFKGLVIGAQRLIIIIKRTRLGIKYLPLLARTWSLLHQGSHPCQKSQELTCPQSHKMSDYISGVSGREQIERDMSEYRTGAPLL